jgi:hypothetical protein
MLRTVGKVVRTGKKNSTGKEAIGIYGEHTL